MNRIVAALPGASLAASAVPAFAGNDNRHGWAGAYRILRNDGYAGATIRELPGNHAVYVSAALTEEAAGTVAANAAQ